jgi:hypothetical protein
MMWHALSVAKEIIECFIFNNSQIPSLLISFIPAYAPTPKVAIPFNNTIVEEEKSEKRERRKKENDG